MNGLNPALMTADERLNEVALILSRGIVRRLNKLKTNNFNEMSQKPLDFRERGRIHGNHLEGDKNP